MSMICHILAFKQADAHKLIGDAQTADVCVLGEPEAESFSWVLMLMETLALLVVFGGMSHQFPKYWYISLAAVLVLFILAWQKNKRPVSEPKKEPENYIRAESELYLDKAWHGIHYLLTLSDWGGDEPYCYLVKGGIQIGSDRYEFGRPRLLDATQAKRFGEAVSNTLDDFLKERYDAEKMLELEIYPNQWNNSGEYEYLHGYFKNLQLFLKSLSKKDHCLVMSVL